MPRRRSSFGRSSSRRTTTTKAPPTTKTTASPPQQKSSGGLFSGFMGTMFQGMAFGAGSEVAHQTVRGMMGSGNASHQQEQAPQQHQVQQQGKIYIFSGSVFHKGFSN